VKERKKVQPLIETAAPDKLTGKPLISVNTVWKLHSISVENCTAYQSLFSKWWSGRYKTWG